jgi:hypothetical protein
MPKDAAKMEKIVALCKRRGFIFQSSEIYGGINGFWDYGPLGVDCPIIKNPKVQDATGRIGGPCRFATIGAAGSKVDWDDWSGVTRGW